MDPIAVGKRGKIKVKKKNALLAFCYSTISFS
jgi:hypothetical protein